MLESVFIVQHATLITHDHWTRDKLEAPYFHIWPLLRTYKTAEEAIIKWQTHCQHLDNEKCCTPGHHFMRVAQHPLNTPQSYYDHWVSDDYMAQFSFITDELQKELQLDSKTYPPLSWYFGDDGKELLNPASLLDGRGGDLGSHFRSWWLKAHGYVKEKSGPLQFPEGDFRNDWELLIWPKGDNPNSW